MKFRVSLIIVLILGLFLTACGKKGIENAKDWPLSNFTYTDHNGESFGLSNLKGKVWVADFIFTSCEDVCLPMTSNMSKLQKLAKDEGIENIEFVSFTVDPTVDQPDILTKFAEQFQVDFTNWHFLTGYSQTEIEKFALENFKTLVKKPEKEDQVIHGTSFYLVDKEGTIVKDYTGLQDIPLDEILSDIKTLQ